MSNDHNSHLSSWIKRNYHFVDNQFLFIPESDGHTLQLGTLLVAIFFECQWLGINQLNQAVLPVLISPTDQRGNFYLVIHLLSSHKQMLLLVCLYKQVLLPATDREKFLYCSVKSKDRSQVHWKCTMSEVEEQACCLHGHPFGIMALLPLTGHCWK